MTLVGRPVELRASPEARRPPLARRRVSLEPNASVVERDDLTATIIRLRLRPDEVVAAFHAGQYFAIGLTVAGTFVQRPYSVATAPGDRVDHDGLEFLVRLVPDGALTPHLRWLRPGDRVRIGPPKGLFRLDAADERQHLFLSTGTGIAPLRSMLASLLAAHPPVSASRSRPARPPVVVQGVATIAELAYRDELERLAGDGQIVYVPSISRPADPANARWRGRTGRLDALVGSIATDAGLEPSSTVAYLCGNPAMIAAVGSRLADLGIPAAAIRAEQYWTPPPAGVQAESGPNGP